MLAQDGRPGILNPRGLMDANLAPASAEGAQAQGLGLNLILFA